MRAMQPHSNKRRPEKEDALHNTDCERSLQHSACFINIQRERVTGLSAVRAEWAQ